MSRIAVIGSGAWGTALAILLAREGHPTQLWGRDSAQLDAMRESRRNMCYLPDAAFPKELQIAADLPEALRVSRDALAICAANDGEDLYARVECG